MTAPRDVRDLDPGPTPPWQQASSPGIRRLALDACRAAVARAKKKRTTVNEEKS